MNHIALRRHILANGFVSLPACGKRIMWPGWNKCDMNDERLAKIEAEYPDHTNTSIRTGYCVGVDIDLTNPAHAVEIEKVIVAHLGDTPLRRVGSKGALLCYHNGSPIPKITIGTKDKRHVEILGTGQQFVAYGIHPDTGKEYEWTNDYIGGEPAVTPLAALPAVTREQLHTVSDAIAAKLAALGYGDISVSGGKLEREQSKPSASAGKPFSPAQLVGMLSYLDPDCPRDEWRDVAAALHAAPCSDPTFDKRELFISWSRGEVRK